MANDYYSISIPPDSSTWANLITIQPSMTAREDKPMSYSTQKKTYLVAFLGSSRTEHIEANGVEEKGERIVFFDHVNGANQLKKSFLGSQVSSYEVVPNQEKPVQPRYLFKLTLADGSTKTVAGDKVLLNNGSEGQPGRYNVVTEISSGFNRTEFLVPESEVKHIERVSDETTKATEVADAG